MTLITTSRKAGQLARRLARALSSAFGCRYITRGKSSFNAVLAQAESLGHMRVVFIYENHGSPNEIRAVQIRRDGTYEDAGRFVFNPIKVTRPRRISPAISYNRGAARFVRLFQEEGCDERGTRPGKDVVDVSLDGKVLVISVNGAEIIILKKTG
ncbi:MAG: hypothetical protein N3G76_03025 [Candidatus Micrarchaeota archaeon]|nr:hypothetical protein [Candidatus Micrarchaeota archaeon]